MKIKDIDRAVNDLQTKTEKLQQHRKKMKTVLLERVSRVSSRERHQLQSELDENEVFILQRHQDMPTAEKQPRLAAGAAASGVMCE